MLQRIVGLWMELPVVKQVPQMQNQHYWDNTVFLSFKRRRGMHWVAPALIGPLYHFNHTEIPPSDPPNNFLRFSRLAHWKKISASSMTLPLKHLALLSLVGMFACCRPCAHHSAGGCVRSALCKVPHHVNNGSAQGKPFCRAIFGTHWASSNTSFIVKNRNPSLNGFFCLSLAYLTD